MTENLKKNKRGARGSIEALPGGGPRSLVGILKCLVSAFFQGFTSLSAIKRQAFVFVGILVNK